MKPERNQFLLSRAETAALLLVLLLILTQLMWSPMVGIASNGDFERLMHWGKFEYVTGDSDEKYFNWINREFRLTKSPWRAWYGFGSSEVLFIKLSAIVGDWIFTGERFDLRLLGVVHVLAFTCAFWLLMKGWRAATNFSPLYLLPGFLLFFCDLGYTVYFNSFYSEPSSLIFLLAMVGAGFSLTLPANRTLPGLLLFCLCAGLFVAAKPQNFSLLPPLLLFCAGLFRLKKERWWRMTLVFFAFALLTAGVLLNVVAPWYGKNTLYHSVFYGILMQSPSPEQDLRDLGLDEKLAVLADTTVFHPNLPIDIKGEEFEERFYRRISRLKILEFYLTHPARFLAKMRQTAERGFTLRLGYAGNFEKASGLPPRAKAERWSGWSHFKQHYWPKSLWLFAAYCIALAWMICRGYRRASAAGKLAREFCLMLWLMMLIAFVTPIIGDGESDLEKHLFLFNALFDLFLLLASGWLLHRVWRVAAGMLQSPSFQPDTKFQTGKESQP